MIRGWPRRRHLDLPILTMGDTGNAVQTTARSEGAKQVGEGPIAFTDDGGVDAINRADQFRAHFAIEISTAKYGNDSWMTQLQAPGKRE